MSRVVTDGRDAPDAGRLREPDAAGANTVKGIVIGLLVSVPLWALGASLVSLACCLLSDP